MVKITHVQSGDVSTPSGNPTLCALVHETRMKLVIYLLTHKEEEIAPEMKDLLHDFLAGLHNIQRAGFRMEDGLTRRKNFMELKGFEAEYQEAKRAFREYMQNESRKEPKFL